MSVLASDIIAGTYQLLGRPSQTDLQYEDVLEHVRDFIRGRILDQKLSARGHTNQIGSWVTPSGREMASSGFVGGLTNFIPVKVEWRYTSQASLSPLPQPYKAEIVAFEQIAELHGMTARDYVAFYDNFENVAFSASSTELSLRQYRVIYEDTSNPTINKTTAVDLPEMFVTLGKYEVGLSCLDQIRNDTFTEERERLRGSFTAQWVIWDDRFKKWQTTQFGNKRVTKVGANARWRSRGRI
jgi:hypothetical protein